MHAVSIALRRGENSRHGAHARAASNRAAHSDVGGAPPLANRPLWWNRDGKAVLHETTSQRTLAWPDPDAVAHHAKAGGDIIAVRWPAARSSADSSLSGAGVGFEY